MKTEGYPMYLQIPGRIIEVVGELSSIENIIGSNIDDMSNDYEHLIPNKGYVMDDYVYVYTDSKQHKSIGDVPILTISKSGDTYTVTRKPSKINSMEVFSVKNLTPMDAKAISDSLVEGEKLYDERELNDMNMASSVFVPEINETDDFLKKVIKQTIINKHIDISRLKSHLTKSYGLSNMKQALVLSTRMSTNVFVSWAELLGIDFTVTVKDNGRDTITPLKHPLTYTSYSDKVIEDLEE